MAGFYGTSFILGAMAGPAGCDVTMGALCTRGFLDEEQILTSDTTGEQVRIRQTTLRILSGSLDLARGDAITANDVAYIVRETQLEDDGAITAVTVARA